jgi:hypothetical protein
MRRVVVHAKRTDVWVVIAAITGCFGVIQACGGDSAAVSKVGASVEPDASTGGTTPSSSSGGTGGVAHVGSGGAAHSGGSSGVGTDAGGDVDSGVSTDAGRDARPRIPESGHASTVRLELENQSVHGVTIQTLGVCGFLPGWFEVRTGDKAFALSGGCVVDASCSPVEYKTLDSGSTVSFDWTVPLLVPQPWGAYHCPGAAPPNGTEVTIRFCWGPLDTSWRYVDAGGNPDFAPAGTDCVDETFRYGADIVVKHVITEPSDAHGE